MDREFIGNDEEKHFHMKALDKWGKISKTIFAQDKEKLRKLLFSINSEMYSKLQQFAASLTSPKIKRQLTLANLGLKSGNSEAYADIKQAIEALEKALLAESEKCRRYAENAESDNKSRKRNLKIVKKQSIITPLMTVKRASDKVGSNNPKSSKRPNSVADVSQSQIKISKV